MRKLPLALIPLSAPLVLAAIACDGDSLPNTTSICRAGQVFKAGTCQQDVSVALNGEGYLPTRRKRAVYQGKSAAFLLRDVKSGAVVHEGNAAAQFSNDAQWEAYVADFTDFQTPGTYVVEAGSDKSGEFVIGPDALDTALHAAMISMFGQRCGQQVDFDYGTNHYSHRPCHLEPASLERVGKTGSKDDTGGWHDAGDYGKYVVNGAFAVGVMLKAWEDFPGYLDNLEFELPEQGGSTPDFLDEARVELEWILKTQLDDGSFAHKVTAMGFENDLMPSDDRQARFFFSASTTATGDAVATLAQAARIFEPFDSGFSAECLAAARTGQVFLDAHPEQIQSEQLPNGQGTGTYGDQNDADERLWALAELWETTGEDAYLSGLEERAAGVRFLNNFDWSNVGNLGLGTYANSSRPGRDPTLVEDIIRQIVGEADTLAARAEEDVYGRDMDQYFWGSNGVIVRTAYNLIAAHKLFPNTAYLDAISNQLDHVLGENPFGRSYVTQLGENPVLKPHHRPSVADSASDPWPGLLIGGPHNQGDLADMNLPAGLNWSDEATNYWHNEVAINWSTGFIYALVAAKATMDDKSADCVPNCVADDGPDGPGGAPND